MALLSFVMNPFTTFIIVIFILLFAAVFFMGSDEYSTFEELSASLEKQVHSVHE